MFETGLVLEGGGTRAIYTSGVLDAFMDKKIEFPYVIGVSAGSCNGASYIGKCRNRQHDITINYSRDKRYMGISNIIKGKGYLNTDWIFGELTYDLSPLDYDTYEKSGTKLCCVVTNALTGKAEYMYPDGAFRNGCVELKASCSLPIAAHPVFIGDIPYYDGGLVDSIPLKHAMDDGCHKAVVILTQHKGYIKKPMSEKIVKIIKKYPKVQEAIANRHIMYNAQLEYVKKMEAEGRAYVIQPGTPLGVGTLEKDLSKLESIYQLGYKQGLGHAHHVKEFINETNI